MRVWLVAAGRMKAGPMRSLMDEYGRRLPWPLAEREIEARGIPAGPTRVEREGQLLLASVPQRARIVALDVGGRARSSESFAAALSTWQESGIADCAFLIGGADGLAPSVLRRADERLSLGPMTWPHLLVRVMLAEQIYRAAAILADHPYHRA